MKWIDIALLAAVAACVFFAVRSLRRRGGKCCGDCCASCSKACEGREGKRR